MSTDPKEANVDLAGDSQPGLADRTRDSSLMNATPSGDPVPVVSPQMAPVEALWSRKVRSIVVLVVAVATIAYVLFGSVLARNVTFNMSQNIDPGRSNGIPRFSRESIVDVWRTMWDKAPDFGSVDATRGILLISTVAFFAAFTIIIALIFEPSQQEWADGFGDAQESDTISGD